VDARGHKTHLGFRSQGWWVNAWLSLAGVSSLWSIESVTECSISTYSAAQFADLLAGNPALMMSILTLQSKELVSLQNQLLDLKEAHPR
jgi:CRP-like cAMP-binding protein